jgi:hypothetical protein
MSKIILKEAERHPGGLIEASRTVGHSLDRFIGTWSAEEEAEFLQIAELASRTYLSDTAS